ncbi:MAG: putative peptidoglycan glycosyltransferase FtsW [Ruminococcus sp.]|nr:putative peptidoglycan glycosyltransferase FtsW [Ruminococcus sp.]
MSESKVYTSRAAVENSQRRVQTPSTAQRRSAHAPQKKKKKLKFFNIGLGLDMPFCLLVLVLLTIGIIMMFSASYPIAYSTYGDSYHFLKRQILFALIGIGAMIGLSFVNYRIFYRFAKLILAISYGVLILVLILPGNGDIHRWIGVGSFTIQASEITKFCLIVFFAYWGTKYADKMRYMKYSFMPGMVIFGTTAILLILEPHFSCTVIVFLLVLIMLFISGMDTKYFILIGVLVGAAIAIMWATGLLGYAMERLDGWGKALEYTTSEMWQTTWQTRNSLYAIGSGGLTGLGLGQSRQKYLYLPEPQNDFIFAIVCEELGLIGAMLILVLFGLLVWRGITMSRKASDTFGKLLGIGLTAQVGLQVILNIFVITDWLPNTGISLPFFSYGGSSLIMLLAQMGVILSVSRSAKIEKR